MRIFVHFEQELSAFKLEAFRVSSIGSLKLLLDFFCMLAMINDLRQLACVLSSVSTSSCFD